MCVCVCVYVFVCMYRYLYTPHTVHYVQYLLTFYSSLLYCNSIC